MDEDRTRDAAAAEPTSDRATAVLAAALECFVRFGYRKTSMDDVARAGRISRPGLYHLFSSKGELFRATIRQALERDLADIERVLDGRDRPLLDRLSDAFECWAGRYIGGAGRDLSAASSEDPGLAGGISDAARARFEQLLIAALTHDGHPQSGHAIATTLISVSIGIKQQVEDTAAYRDRMRIALDLVLPTAQ